MAGDGTGTGSGGVYEGVSPPRSAMHATAASIAPASPAASVQELHVHVHNHIAAGASPHRVRVRRPRSAAAAAWSPGADMTHAVLTVHTSDTHTHNTGVDVASVSARPQHGPVQAATHSVGSSAMHGGGVLGGVSWEIPVPTHTSPRPASRDRTGSAQDAVRRSMGPGDGGGGVARSHKALDFRSVVHSATLAPPVEVVGGVATPAASTFTADTAHTASTARVEPDTVSNAHALVGAQGLATAGALAGVDGVTGLQQEDSGERQTCLEPD